MLSIVTRIIKLALIALTMASRVALADSSVSFNDFNGDRAGLTYNFQGSQVSYSASFVCNHASANKYIFVGLELTNVSNSGDSYIYGFNGAEAGTDNPPLLSPGQCEQNLSHTQSFTSPPAGTYQVTLLLSGENSFGSSSSMTIDDSSTFSQTVTFSASSGGGCSSNCVTPSGNVSANVDFSDGNADLHVDKITNDSSQSTGTLRLELWLTTQPYTGGGISSGYRLAISQITTNNGVLAPGTSFTGVDSGTVAASNFPSPGNYYEELIVSEYEPSICASSDGFCEAGFASFPQQLNVPVIDDGSGSGGGAMNPILLLAGLLIASLRAPIRKRRPGP